MTITVIGLGLIGGSMALDLRRAGWANRFIGVDSRAEHGARAVELGIVDEVLPLAEAVSQADFVILSVPVNAMRQLVGQVLDVLPPHAVLFDVGSTKKGICDAARQHPNRANFVACHPLAGTENTGPDAAIYQLFKGKVNMMCECELSHDWAVAKVERLFAEGLQMRNLVMSPTEHDRHIAYVSHLSHITSFTLGLTVLDIEKDEDNIFNMASTGFTSTVRLAKSSANMWTPIFEENAENLSVAIEQYIARLQAFKHLIDTRQSAAIFELIEQANDIRRILDRLPQ
jgi:prephenate dehydrogenase